MLAECLPFRLLKFVVWRQTQLVAESWPTFGRVVLVAFVPTAPFPIQRTLAPYQVDYYHLLEAVSVNFEVLLH